MKANELNEGSDQILDLAPLEMSALMFEGDDCAYVVIKILCAGHNFIVRIAVAQW